MTQEVEMVVQMVEKVVKPLLKIQEEMTLVNTQFNRLKEEWDGLNYQSLELYERWREQEQSLEDNVARLEHLSETIEQSSQVLTVLETHLDTKIQAGIQNAAKKLVADFRRDTFAAVKQEINEAAIALNTVAEKAKEGIESCEAITFLTHLKYIGLALVLGVLSSTVTFLIYRHQARIQPPCECECVLQKIEGSKKEEVVRARS